MVSRPLRHHRVARQRRPAWRLWGSLLYGRALRLTDVPALPLALPPSHSVAHGLRRFQRRLHLQRAAVTLARALALAALAATVVLLLRAFGQDVSLPLAPLITAGVLLVALVASIPLQRPSLPQMACALDK